MMKFLGLLVGILVLVVIGAMTAAGVMPFLSPLLIRPVDLGVAVDPAFVRTFDERIGMKNELPGGIVPDGREPEYTGTVRLDESFSSDQVTSILAYWRGLYAKMPIRNVQVRFNADGSGEVSGILEVNTAVAMAKQLGYSDEQIEQGKQYVQFIAGDIPFYAKGTAGVVNNAVAISPASVVIGRIPVPSGIVEPLTSVVTDAIERRIPQVTGLNIEYAGIENGQFRVKADAPDTIR